MSRLIMHLRAAPRRRAERARPRPPQRRRPPSGWRPDGMGAWLGRPGHLLLAAGGVIIAIAVGCDRAGAHHSSGRNAAGGVPGRPRQRRRLDRHAPAGVGAVPRHVRDSWHAVGAGRARRAGLELPPRRRSAPRQLTDAAARGAAARAHEAAGGPGQGAARGPVRGLLLPRPRAPGRSRSTRRVRGAHDRRCRHRRVSRATVPVGGMRRHCEQPANGARSAGSVPIREPPSGSSCSPSWTRSIGRVSERVSCCDGPLRPSSRRRLSRR